MPPSMVALGSAAPAGPCGPTTAIFICTTCGAAKVITSVVAPPVMVMVAGGMGLLMVIKVLFCLFLF